MKFVTKKYIDINCDLGEGYNNEAQLMPLISSCNIACGGHAGNAATMEVVVDLAEVHKVKIGAHPSFPDKANFGRKMMSMSAEELRKSLTAQIDNLMKILKRKNLSMHHVKPHGALYNLVAKDKKTAQLVVEAIKSIDKNLVLYAPYQSVIAEIAQQNELEVAYEAFADRNYNADLSLVSRAEPQALIHDPEAMFEHVYRMVSHGKVKTLDGVEVAIKADTFCVHGDAKNVVTNLKQLHARLKKNQIQIS